MPLNSSNSRSQIVSHPLNAQAQIQLNEVLSKINENNELRTQLLRQQIAREKNAKRLEHFQLRKYKAEAKKAEYELKKAKIDAELAETLRSIEIKKAQKLADLQIDAQRKEFCLQYLRERIDATHPYSLK